MPALLPLMDQPAGLQFAQMSARCLERDVGLGRQLGGSESLAAYEAYRARLAVDPLGKENYEFAQREKCLLCEDRSPDQLLSFVDPLWCDRWGCAYFEVGSPNETATTDDAEDCPSCHDPVRDDDLAYVAGDPALLYAGSYQRQERFLRGVLGRPL